MKNKKRILCGCLIVLLICVGLGYYVKRTLPLGRTDFNSFEHFEKMNRERVRCDLPDGAQDVTYYLNWPILFKHSIFSFTIEDEEVYQAYIKDEFGGFGDKKEYVSDYVGLAEGDYAEFPTLPFEKVISDDITKYTILKYEPGTCASAPEGVVVNEETHRFVAFYIRMKN